MRLLIFALGVLTGLTFTRIPHYVGPLFQDDPQTPTGWEPKYREWHSGRPSYEDSISGEQVHP